MTQYIYTVIITEDNTCCYVSLWSTSSLAFNFVKSKFKLPDEANDDNYMEYIPEKIYCSIDRMLIDRTEKNYEGTFHDFQISNT